MAPPTSTGSASEAIRTHRLGRGVREERVPRTVAKGRTPFRVRGARNDTDLFVDLSDETAVSVTIAESLKRLSRRQRDVIVLRYLMDYDEQTTAAVMGTSVSNVKAAAHEARQRLNPLLANVYGAMDEVRP